MAILISVRPLLGIAKVMDFSSLFRMIRAGNKTALFLGGAFDYGKYHGTRSRYGWSACPVDLTGVLIILGLLFLVAGCFQHFGSNPRRDDHETRWSSGVLDRRRAQPLLASGVTRSSTQSSQTARDPPAGDAPPHISLAASPHQSPASTSRV